MLEQAKAKGDEKFAEYSAHCGIGTSFINMGRFDEAALNLKFAADCSRDMGNKEGEAQCFLKIAGQ